MKRWEDDERQQRQSMEAEEEVNGALSSPGLASAQDLSPLETLSASDENVVLREESARVIQRVDTTESQQTDETATSMATKVVPQAMKVRIRETVEREKERSGK